MWTALLAALVAQAAPTEVVFVGTQHFISDMPAGYEPGHLRALLDRIKPAALAVEAPANLPDPWLGAPLELQWVTRPWAEAAGVPAVPAGWDDRWYGTRVQLLVDALQKAGKGEAYQALEARLQRTFAADTSCEGLNGEKGIDLWRQYHRELRGLVGGDTPWDTWNSRILEKVRDVLKAHRGRRVAIVFGAAHGSYLIDALSKDEGVKVIPCSTFLLPAAEEVAARTTPRDHLRALRRLNFGAVEAVDLEAMARHLDLIRDVALLAGDVDLFTGKLLLHRKDLEGARARFRAAAGREGVSVFDGTTRLSEAGAIQAAVVLARQGKPAEARVELEAVLAAPALTPAMKAWAEQVLRELPPAK